MSHMVIASPALRGSRKHFQSRGGHTTGGNYRNTEVPHALGRFFPTTESGLGEGYPHCDCEEELSAHCAGYRPKFRACWMWRQVTRMLPCGQDAEMHRFRIPLRQGPRVHEGTWRCQCWLCSSEAEGTRSDGRIRVETFDVVSRKTQEEDR